MLSYKPLLVSVKLGSYDKTKYLYKGLSFSNVCRIIGIVFISDFHQQKLFSFRFAYEATYIIFIDIDFKSVKLQLKTTLFCIDAAINGCLGQQTSVEELFCFETNRLYIGDWCLYTRKEKAQSIQGFSFFICQVKFPIGFDVCCGFLRGNIFVINHVNLLFFRP